MARHIAIIGFGLAAIVAANAGQIQIGGVNGLTTSAVTSGGVQHSYNAGNASTFASASITYSPGQGGDINGVANTQALPNGNGSSGAYTLTDQTSGTVFNMINQTVAGNPMNVWSLGSSTAMVIPIGVFDVTSVWTMLDNRWGDTNPATSPSTSVEFDFNSAADGSGTATSVTFQLINGQEIASAVSCTAKTTAPGIADCTTFKTTVQASSTATITGSDISGSSTATVLANQIWSANYSGGTAGNPYQGTSGTLSLFDQGFDLTQLANYSSVLSNDWLIQVKITDLNFAAATATFPSRTEISAITVNSADIAPTPEPASFALLLVGLGSIGIARLRRR